MVTFKDLDKELLGTWHETTSLFIIVVKNDMHISGYNKQFSEHAAKFTNIFDLITYTHKSAFLSKLNQCIKEESIVSFNTNFSYDKRDVEDIPNTFKITMQYLGDDEIIIVAEPVCPLSHDNAKAYFAMVNEYSSLYRKLQKSEYTLHKKNIELKEKVNEVKHLADYDFLTNIYNRRKIFKELSKEYSRYKRHGHIFSTVMIDVDDFKHMNDTYGHQCGDIVLSEITTLIKSMLREYDSVGRFGGEEFLIILPSTELSQALSFIERMLKKISDTKILLADNQKTHITVSAGVSQIDEEMSLDELISIADTQLYKAKEEGKNRVK